MSKPAAAAATAGEPEAPASAADTPPAVQLRLPRMGKFKVPEIAFKFTGRITTRLTSEDDVKLSEALSLGARGTVTFDVDGRETPLVLAFRVDDEGGGFVKPAGSDEIVRGRRRVLIGDGAVEDDDGED